LNGTCEWISTHPIFLRWKSTTASSVSDRLLCIYGAHGCGKTVLASAIAQSLKTQGQRILFFSFSGIDACRQTLDGLIRAILWQLLQELTSTRSLDIMANLMLRGQPLTSELWDIYNRIVALGGEEKVYWIIDGVDECGEPIQKVFHQVLELLTNHKTTRVILSGRPYIVETIGDATDNKIQLSPCLTKPDLDAFIDAEISKSKILCHSVLREHVTRGLRQKSDGMFLWVKLMIDDLRKASSRYEVTERRQNLPRGLQEAYRMLLSRLVDRLDRFELRLLRCILAFTIVSCRTMRLEELQYAQALQYMSALCTSTAPSLQDYLLEEPTQKILGVCGGLVNITNGFVNLVHVSVKEFLTRPEDEWQRGNNRRIIELRIDEEESHHSFNSICIDYLRMGGYGSPLQNPDIFSTHETRYPFLDYSSRFMIQHFNRSRRASSATISKMNAFLEADICVSWMEYFAIVLVEDGLSGAQMQSLAEFISWLEKGGYAQEFALKLQTRIEQELSIRKQKYGKSDLRTEQLQMIRNLVEESANFYAPVEATVPITSDSIRDDSMARVSQLITVINSAKTLPIHCQFDFLLKLQRQLQRAEALTDPLELLFRLILGKAAIVPLYALLAIASFCGRLGRYDKALEFYLAAFAKVENREVPNKFLILHEIGWVRSAQGQYLEAEKMCQRALQGREKALGAEHTSTLTTANNLGTVYMNQGKLDEAEKMY
jgi:tetratricopeptide (TPR) repeat protein